MLRVLTCMQATASRMPHLKAAIGAPNDQLEPSSYKLPLRSGCHLCIPRSAVKLACACFLITGSVTYSMYTVQRAVRGVQAELMQAALQIATCRGAALITTDDYASDVIDVVWHCNRKSAAVSATRDDLCAAVSRYCVHTSS
jgi:hypothetical protein